MPEMSGFEIITMLKESKDTNEIPVIFITGLTSAEDEEKGFSLGAVDYITKPFSPVIVKMRVLNQINLIIKTRLIVAKEIAEKSSRAKRDFLSRMSHEMRTPMNAIMGMTALAKKEDDRELLIEHLNVIDASSSELLRLIDGVLDIADMEDDKITLDCSDFNVRAMVREVLDQTSESRKQKKQSLSVDIDREMPNIVFGDKKRFFQVINNLLSNAIKFTDEQGLIKLKISATEYKDETATLHFEISDNGIGISKEQHDKLFALFEQVDGSETRQFEGIGSGLFIAKNIVEMMGGQIWVESELGCGSKFVFTVKVKTNTPVLQDNPLVN
jgi:signal transduction histidine kinase